MEKKEFTYRRGTEITLAGSIYRLDEDNIFHVVAVGDTDDAAASEYCTMVLELFEQADAKVDWLIDLNKAGKQSHGARKAFKEMSEHPKTGKVAIFGLHPVAKTIASFVMVISANKNWRFFSTKQQALLWIKQE